MNGCFFDGHDAISALFILFFISIALLTTVLVSILAVVIWCKICSKAGYCWALGLLILVPIANIILPVYLAFSKWPVIEELRKLKQQVNKKP